MPQPRIILSIFLLVFSSQNLYAAACPEKNTLNPKSRILSNPWGSELINSRFQSSENAGINAKDVPRLKLKWAYYLPPRFPGTSELRSQPAVTEDTLYLGAQDSNLYALDTETGCTRWTYEHDIQVRSGVVLGDIGSNGSRMVFFGDDNGFVTALDANTGKSLWKTEMDSHPNALITAAPTLYKDQLYVSVSSLEVVSAMNPFYNCCTFRGSVARVDALTGKIIWQTYSAPKSEKAGTNKLGVQMWGPSGAPIWNTPSIDAKRNALYAGTGENYSSPASKGSDSILAIDLDSGKLLWEKQLTSGDAWNMSCTLPGKLNCPKEDGFDLDVGANTILYHLNDDSDLVIAGQKSGIVWALDPDKNGAVVWKSKVGRGGALGGIHWGIGSDDRYIYAPNSDYELSLFNIIEARRPPGEKSPSLNALDPKTGKIAWKYTEKFNCPDPDDCDDGFSAPPSIIPGVVFAGTMLGKLYAFNRDSGAVIWEYDTTQSVMTISGDEGHGGSIDVDGAVIAGGQLYIHSGYGKMGKDGNVLLVFSIDGK
ncbi:MAG: PQQ-binding-like beta-propeller repeat protein [Pseudomonadales bacterium]|nr:PQQ-binding-like beta-propeller repeat protein [Pseudomonadales bacterium]